MYLAASIYGQAGNLEGDLYKILILLILPLTALASDRYYGSLNVGFLTGQNNYSVDYLYEGSYMGYATTTQTTGNCNQCTAPVTGLYERNIPFVNTSYMQSNSGLFGSAALGIDIPDFFTIGIQISYLNKNENANESLSSTTWYVLLDAEYVLFSASSEILSPYIGVGIGFARQSADGGFELYAENSIRGVQNIPTILTVSGKFSDAVSTSIALQLRLGLTVDIGGDAYVDIGGRYLATSYSVGSASTGTSSIVRSTEIVQDPGAALSNGAAGCNGNACTQVASPSQTTPITFRDSMLRATRPNNDNLIVDIGLRFAF